MKALFIGGLLLCIVVCNACGGKRNQDGKIEESEPVERGFIEECKALEWVDASMKKYINCFVLTLVEVVLEKLPASTTPEECERNWSNELTPVDNLQNQGKISLEFNSPEQLKTFDEAIKVQCAPPADADATSSIVVEWFKGLSGCMENIWNQDYLELKKQYNCS